MDTDVILDVLLDREKFVEDARKILQKIELKEVEGFTSPVVLANLYYISSSLKNKKTALSYTRKIHKLLKMTRIDQDVVNNSLEAEKIKDFEDNLQLYSAIGMGLDFLITRNVKDYLKTDLIRILTPKEMVELLEMGE